MTIEIRPPKYAKNVLNAIEKSLKSHDLRCKPGVTLQNVADVLVENQFTVAEGFGQLQLTQHNAPVHAQTAIEGLARKKSEFFYPRDVTGVRSRDEMDSTAKVKFIKEKGLSAFERLPQKHVEQPVVLDQDTLTRSQWLSLDLNTRSDLAGQWPTSVLSEIMQRK